MIANVFVNHTERNYFDDYSEIRNDVMVGVSKEKVIKAIDKLVRRYRKDGTCDCMFFESDDNTGFRLMYDYDYSRNFEDADKQLRLRHYTNWKSGSWDSEKVVTAAEAKRTIIGKEEW